MSNKVKYSLSALGATTALILSIAGYEGYTSRPVIPVPGDVPTIGHGTTSYPNGVKVKMTDKPIDRKTAEHYLRNHVSKTEMQFKKSLSGVKLAQTEYDVYVDFVYQYGMATWNKSSIRSNLLKGNYKQACASLLKYKYVAKRDCSVRSSNCFGVWTRQVARYEKCMEAN